MRTERDRDGRTDKANSHFRNFANTSKTASGYARPLSNDIFVDKFESGHKFQNSPAFSTEAEKPQYLQDVLQDSKHKLLLSDSVVNYTYDSEEKVLVL
jgi:hypothetical protein